LHIGNNNKKPRHDKKKTTSMDPDQPAPLHSLIRIQAVRLPTILQDVKLIANSMDPDQLLRLVWIHDGRKRTVGFVVTRLKYQYIKQELL
jgi:hypothetical protein